MEFSLSKFSSNPGKFTSFNFRKLTQFFIYNKVVKVISFLTNCPVPVCFISTIVLYPSSASIKHAIILPQNISELSEINICFLFQSLTPIYHCRAIKVSGVFNPYP